MDKAELMPSDVMLPLSVLVEAWKVVGVAMLDQAGLPVMSAAACTDCPSQPLVRAQAQ